ncbi:sensory transduction histidine kinase [Methanosarcina siciliae HI350]|uniref:Sensory transduction histidine kinase n=1 Tax=Methanosarcina siciliae HI350 TaxID=1434119 RepID=A0A0E3PD78_9EURY|nr:MEDS domain-containing protein [Methanosarcina siciliae]AKB32412.1 sensory transduction histidine kinase [Methanosarcina siciliae HI350]
MEGKLRNSGIGIIGNVPWGTHFCQFYQTKEDLMEILVPYFKAGLENNENCIWITSQLLEVEEAKEALRRAVPDFEIYLKKGQIEIFPYIRGYINEGVFDSERAVNGLKEKLNQALERGYEGLRVTGDACWLEKEGWTDFVNYENKVDSVIEKHQMISLCSYHLEMCNATEILDIAFNHRFSLIKREGLWDRIENSGRRRAEKAVFQAAKDWEQTFDAVPDLVAIIDNECRIVRANRAMAARLGVTQEECSGLTCHRVMHGTDEPPSFCPHKQLLKDGLERITEVHEELLGGDFVLSVSPLYGPDGKIMGCVHVARDITERKRAEKALKKAHECLEEKVKARTAELEEAYKALKENEGRLSEAQKMAHIGNWDWDLVTNRSYWSDEMYRIFGLEPQEFGLTYDKIFNYIHPDDRDYLENSIKRALNEGSCDSDYRIISDDGGERVVHAQGEVVFDEENKPILMKGTVQDITERKKAEEALEKMERIRIKEIHHRIKNNLQVISSLLDLQAEKFRDKEVLEAFRESQNRVISMSLIHEELYKGKGNDALDFSAYLRKLSEKLFQTYSLNGKNISLYMNLEENTSFNMDIAVPLGIIVNEIVSNAFKHAFPEKKGEIRIQLQKEKICNEVNRSLFSLKISDNGIGIPEGMELASFESLGMKLVNTLIDQLCGKIEIIRAHGTEFRITFNVTERSQIPVGVE